MKNIKENGTLPPCGDTAPETPDQTPQVDPWAKWDYAVRHQWTSSARLVEAGEAARATVERQHAELLQLAEAGTALERQSTVRLRAEHAAQIAERDAEIARLSALAEGACADAFTHCACGCPISDHESYDEDGEQCEHEGHECFRVSASAAATITKLRAPERAEAALTAMSDAAEMLWVVLANVSGGDWTQQTPEWQEAAARWRDAYFAAFTAIHPVPAPPTGEEAVLINAALSPQEPTRG